MDPSRRSWSTSSVGCAIAGACGSRCAARWSSSPARCWRCSCRPRASRRSASAPPAIITFRIVTVAVFVGLLLLRPGAGRCAGASPTRRSRCISRSATRRSKPRSSARSKRPSDGGSAGALAAPGREAGRAGDRAVPRRSITAARSSATAVQRHAGALGGDRASRRCCSSRSARRSCATGCRRCSSSRAAPKRRARTASKSRPATPRCRAAPIRRSRRSSSASRRATSA